MSRNQRLGFLGVAAVIAVVAVVVVLIVGGGSDSSTSSGEVPTLKTGKVTKMEFKQGDTVRFKVVSDKAQEVHVHGYNLMKDTVPGKPIEFSFKGTINGIFVVEFEESGEQIGELRVDPK
jgi:hypothetical protein